MEREPNFAKERRFARKTYMDIRKAMDTSTTAISQFLPYHNDARERRIWPQIFHLRIALQVYNLLLQVIILELLYLTLRMEWESCMCNSRRWARQHVTKHKVDKWNIALLATILPNTRLTNAGQEVDTYSTCTCEV